MEQLKRRVKLKTLDSKVYPIQVDKDILVLDLKKIVSEKTKIPVELVRMISKARLLKDQERLSQHITKDDQTIHVMNKPPPQQPSTQQPPASQEQSQTQQQPSQQNNQNTGNFQSFQTPNGSATIGSIQIPDGDNSNLGGILGNLLQGVVGDSGNVNSLMSNVNSLFSNIRVSSQSNATGGGIPNSNSNSSNNQNATTGNSNPRVNIMRSVNLLPGLNSTSSFQSNNPVLNTMPNQSANTNQPSQSNSQPNSSSGNVNSAHNASSASQGRFNLPYQSIFRMNQTINSVYGMQSFPGPSLPSTSHPRNPITQMGQYLLSLNFALNRLSPLLLRTGQLLSREHFLDGRDSRRETQRFSNFLGVAMHQLAIALINVSHLYRNMTLGQNQGQFQISADAPQYFRAIMNQNSGARNYNSFNRALNDRGFQNVRGQSRSGPQNNLNQASNQSNTGFQGVNSQQNSNNLGNPSSNSNNNNNNNNNPQGQEELKQQIVIQVDMQQQIDDNDEDYQDIDDEQFQDAIQEQIIDVTIPNFQQSMTQNQVNSQPPPPQPTHIQSVTQTHSAAPTLAPQQQNSHAGTNILNNIHQALNNTPQGQMAQNMLGGMMPMINSIVSNSSGARTIGEIAANMQARQMQSEADSQGIDVQELKDQARKVEEKKSLMAKVLENLEIPDIFAIINGNLGKLMHMVPKIQKIIKEQMQLNPNYQDGQIDTPQNRKFIIKRISQGLKLDTPQSMKDKIKPTYDPVMHSSHIIEREMNKMLNFFMDFKKEEFGATQQQVVEEFSIQLKSKLRNFVGELIDQLKEVFVGGIDDEELNEPPNGPMSMMMSNLIMGYVNTGYQQYESERDTRIIQNSISGGQQGKDIQLNKRNSQQLLKQWKETIDKDAQLQKKEGKQRPLSKMYRTLNAFIGLGSGIMSQLQEYGVTLGMAGSQEEQKSQRGKLNFLKDKMDVLERRIRSTLNSKGYEKSAIDKSFGDRPIPIMLSKKYKSLLKEELKERAKTDPDYEEGKWEKLDRLLKE